LNNILFCSKNATAQIWNIEVNKNFWNGKNEKND